MEESLERLRAMYHLSVEKGEWASVARDSVAALRLRTAGISEWDVTIEGYRGALEVVRAKHSKWPPNKLKYFNRGAATLDALVEANPENLELRYLRFASYRFLPFFLRRDDSLAADLRALASGLPEHPETFSPTVYGGVVRFLLENGDLAEDERARLEGALPT
jgi:hypothetical protein